MSDGGPALAWMKGNFLENLGFPLFRWDFGECENHPVEQRLVPDLIGDLRNMLLALLGSIILPSLTLSHNRRQDGLSIGPLLVIADLKQSVGIFLDCQKLLVIEAWDFVDQTDTITQRLLFVDVLGVPATHYQLTAHMAPS